jgi:hypothetical protein
LVEILAQEFTRMNGDRTNTISFFRIRFSLITVPLGLLIFAIGAKPNWFGWDRTPVVGFIQITVFLIGLALICLGGFVGLSALWGREQRSIIADIGLRLVATGYVIAVFTGFADVFGLGTQPLPKIPYFGPWQAGGVLIGEIVIAIGFLMVIPYRFYFSRIHR